VGKTMSAREAVEKIEGLDQVGIVWTPGNSPIVIQVLWADGATLVRSTVDPGSPFATGLKAGPKHVVTWSITAAAPIEQIGVFLRLADGTEVGLERKTKLARGATWSDSATWSRP
jgi:hypothetical protein